VSFPTWWFNVRASNTQPLLRLNVEADDRQTLEQKSADVLAMIRGGAKRQP
jgi:phosphomannomutase